MSRDMDDTQAHAQEQDAEQEVQREHEDPTKASAPRPNRIPAALRPGGSHAGSRTGRHDRGDPDAIEVDDADAPGDPAAPPADDPFAAARQLGDEGWEPPVRQVAPPLDLDRWEPDPRPPEAVVRRRLEAARRRSGAVDTVPRPLLEPVASAVSQVADPWIDQVVALWPAGPVRDVLGWMTGPGRAVLLGAEGAPLATVRSTRRRRLAFGLALATHATGLLPAPPEPSARLALALRARRALLDRAEQQAAATGALGLTPVLGRAPFLGGVPPQDLPTRPAPGWPDLFGDWLGLRPGRTWRAALPRGVSPADDDPMARLLGPSPDQLADQQRQRLAEVAIGLFTEVQRARLRTAEGAAALLEVVPRGATEPLLAHLHASAERLDRTTDQVFRLLGALGRGLNRPPFLPMVQARDLLVRARTTWDVARERLLDDLARTVPLWRVQGPPPPRPPRDRPGPLRDALERGRLDRARALAAPHPDALALLDLAQGRGPGDHPLAPLLATVAPAPGVSAEAVAQTMARLGHRSRQEGRAATVAFAALSEATAHSLAGQAPRAEQALLTALTWLHAHHHAAWMQAVSRWVPPA